MGKLASTHVYDIAHWDIMIHISITSQFIQCCQLKCAICFG